MLVDRLVAVGVFEYRASGRFQRVGRRGWGNERQQRFGRGQVVIHSSGQHVDGTSGVAVEGVAGQAGPMAQGCNGDLMDGPLGGEHTNSVEQPPAGASGPRGHHTTLTPKSDTCQIFVVVSRLNVAAATRLAK